MGVDVGITASAFESPFRWFMAGIRREISEGYLCVKYNRFRSGGGWFSFRNNVYLFFSANPTSEDHRTIIRERDIRTYETHRKEKLKSVGVLQFMPMSLRMDESP